jgi:hypothetical protein
MSCEIEVAMNADRTETYRCLRPSSLIFYECGTRICNLHTEECGLCNEFLCIGCAYPHMQEEHPKKTSVVRPLKAHRSA